MILEHDAHPLVGYYIQPYPVPRLINYDEYNAQKLGPIFYLSNKEKKLKAAALKSGLFTKSSLTLQGSLPEKVSKATKHKD
jgi:hypothetical protein